MAWHKNVLPAGQLTPYSVGSLRELWTLSYPLMLSFLSIGLMVFVDRLFLAHLSYDAFNAASEASMFFITVEFSLVSLVSIAEVFVGKAYGAREFDKVAWPVWTMIWLAIFSIAIFIPVGLWSPHFLFANSPYCALETVFFRTLSFFGPIILANTALSAFWIGRGKTCFVTGIALVANLINIALDPLLIFGYGNLPQLGIAGAGIATGLSQMFQMAVMFACFLSKRYSAKYKTWDYQFRWDCLKEAVLLGFSQAFSQFVQAAGWSVFFRIMTLASPQHILVAGIAQSILFLFNFIIEGVSKAASSISANLLGAGRYREIGKIAWAGIRLHAIFAAILACLLIIYPDPLIWMFVPEEKLELGLNTHQVIRASLFWIWLTLIGESLLFLWSGLLITLHDTRFILLTSSSLIWILGVFPAYFVTVHWHQPAHVACAVACMYYLATGIAYYIRLGGLLQEEGISAQSGISY